jgi:hypothetical protein
MGNLIRRRKEWWVVDGMVYRERCELKEDKFMYENHFSSDKREARMKIHKVNVLK